MPFNEGDPAAAPAYLIYSAEHAGGRGPRRHGYVRHPQNAGLYTCKEAVEICADAIPGGLRARRLSEFPVRLEDPNRVLKAAKRGVLDRPVTPEATS